MARECIKCRQVKLDCEFVIKAQTRKGLSCFCSSCFQSAAKWEISLRNFIDRREIPFNRASDMYIKKANIEKIKSEHKEKKKRWMEMVCSANIRGCFDNQVLKNFENSQRFRLENRKERSRRKTAELDDSYIAALLSNGTGIKASKIPGSLIEAKRVQILIKRLLKERKQ